MLHFFPLRDHAFSPLIDLTHRCGPVNPIGITWSFDPYILLILANTEKINLHLEM